MARTVWVPKDAVAAALPRDTWPALERVAYYGHERVPVEYGYERAEGGHVVSAFGYGLTVPEIFDTKEAA